MLVLTRKNGQTIQVGEISITLVGVKGDRARIGIDAPREVPILRGEIAGRENNESMDGETTG